jgi:tRNA(adenine34) deaminase
MARSFRNGAALGKPQRRGAGSCRTRSPRERTEDLPAAVICVSSVPVAPPPIQPCPFEKRFPSQLTRDDAFFMSLAYNQAIDAWREDEVPIGAVVEAAGEVIGAAHNSVETSHDPTAHAEILALTQAAAKLGDWRLAGATVYVTKEPCPMCAGALVMARVKRVCFAVGDPKMGCLGGATDLNALPRSNHRLEVSADGPLEPECRELIQAFFRLKRGGADEP